MMHRPQTLQLSYFILYLVSILSGVDLISMHWNSFLNELLPYRAESFNTTSDSLKPILQHGSPSPSSSSSLPPPKSLPPPLEAPTDFEQYTIRINSWERQEQLQLSLQHYQTCHATVALIQVVWCLAQGPVPEWLLQLERNSASSSQATDTHSVRVVVEQHELNSLNERFRVLSPIPTPAVLSIDDDVLRPCVALDSAFIKWTRNPRRMVGFDVRTITPDPINNDWKYGTWKETHSSNRYALALSRFAFVHQHYLHTYMTDLPSIIRDQVDQDFNCEDIALSLWVSYQSNNLPPLVVDFWAIKMVLNLHSTKAISSTTEHLGKRDVCVRQFSNILEIDVPKLVSEYVHSKQSKFDCGAPLERISSATQALTPKKMSVHLQRVQEVVHRWKRVRVQTMLQEMDKIMADMARPSQDKGFAEQGDPWKRRFKALMKKV